MFTPAERESLRDALVAKARADGRITAGALTGSSSSGAEDAWSDIDLAFGVAPDADSGQIVADWTARMYDEHGAVHHTDITAGSGLFRVFLLGNTLQVDIAFWPQADFGALAPTFRLLFGRKSDRPHIAPPSVESLAGMAWLYALHARASIARGRVWQAEYMISGMRDHVLALACVRHGLPAVQARGIDTLPPRVAAPLTAALVRSLELPELVRAFDAAALCFLGELARIDTALERRLAGPVRELVRSAALPHSL